MEKKTKIILLSFLVVILIILLVLGIYVYLLLMPAEFEELKGINLDKEGFSDYLEEHILVQELPKDANVKIKIDDTSYSVSQGVVKEMEVENQDIEIIISENYLSKIGEEGLCEVMDEGLESGEIVVKTALSESDLAWKYRNVVKYRECFGDY